MKYTLSKISLLMIATGFIASCATASLKETWRNPSAPTKPYSRLLVVGKANDDNVRRMFENIFVDTLQKQGVMALPSHALIPDLDKADRATLQETARKAGADAVVITRGIAKSERINYQYATGEVQYRTGVMEESGPDSEAIIAMSAVGIAPRETAFELATLLTNFFDAATVRLLWSATSDISEAGNRAKACWELSALLVEAMRKDRMIAGN